jgi:uncharacterized protein (TIGR03663 family)
MKSRRRRANRRAAAAQPVTPPPAIDDSALAAAGVQTTDAPAATGSRPAQAIVAPQPLTNDPISDRWFWIGAFVVLVVAALIRLPELGMNPFHHDEGVNGWFTTTLVRSGSFQYDPANYHGPTLFYFALLSEILFGLTNEAMRLVPVVFGLVTVGTVIGLRPVLGSIPVLVGGLLLALSPGAVYVSRYFIHEALLVAFTMTLVASALLYLRSRNPAWALGVGASAALIFATKETGVITVAVLAIAAVVSGIYVNWRSGGSDGRGSARGGPRRAGGAGTSKPAKTIKVDGVEYRAVPDRSSRSLLDGVIPGGIPLDHVAAATIVFLSIYVLFFSSFFTNFPKGLVDSLATFTIWTQTGGATQVAPFQQYLVWMATADAPILILGTIGGLIAAIQGRDRLWVFIGLWALGITLAYSLLAYKTPWIALNMLLPLALLGGLAIREAALLPRWRPVAVGAVVLATAASAFLAYDLNYVNYDTDSPRYPYVYVHSTREMLTMLDQIEDVAADQGTGTDTGITIVSPDYWPLPWYLRDYPKAGFWGRLEDVTLDQPIIIANTNQREQLEPLIAGRFEQAGTYQLRPGVDLDVYVRTDEAAS